MAIEFRYLDEGDIGQCLDILHQFFGANYYGADERYVRWQYLRSPFTEKLVGAGRYSILAAMEDRRILALDAFLVWNTLVAGRDALTFWDIQWINAAKVPGLGRRLVQELRSRCQVYAGFGLNELSKNSYTKLGYRVCDQIERMVAILDAPVCAQLFAPQAPPGQAEFLAQRQAPRDGFPFHVFADLEGLSPAYWDQARQDFLVLSYKGPEYLRWRFLEHPFLRYHLVSTDSRGLGGLAVVKLEQLRDRPQVVARVVEMMPAAGRQLDLARAVIAFGQAHGAIMADFFCVSHQYARLVCPQPFMPLAEHSPFNLPRLFQPLEFRQRQSINMVLDADPQFPEVDFQSFYATKADSDQDVYVNPEYRTVSL